MSSLSRPSAGRHLAVSLCSAVFALYTSGAAIAQTYPTKLIELIVPYPAGGTNDVVARMVADGLTTELGQKVLILNKAGGSASLGSVFVKRAPADGYTLLLGSQGTHSANPYLLKNMSYDALKDFVPVAMVGKVNNVLVVPTAFPAKSLAEFNTYAKKHPGTINFSHAGAGTSMSLAGELFKLKTGDDIVPIPYQGSAPATLAVVSGEVQAMFANTTSVLQHIQSGKLRPLGVTGAQRDPLLPEVKTLAELGIRGYDIQSWFGIFAPANTPLPVVARLNLAIRKILTRPDVVKRFDELGVSRLDMNAGDFRSYVETDNVAIGKLVREAGLKAE